MASLNNNKGRNGVEAWMVNLSKEGTNGSYFYSYSSHKTILTTFKPASSELRIHDGHYLTLGMYIHTDRYVIRDGHILPLLTKESCWLTLNDDDDWHLQRECNSYEELLGLYLRWPIIIDKEWIWRMGFN